MGFKTDHQPDWKLRAKLASIIALSALVVVVGIATVHQRTLDTTSPPSNGDPLIAMTRLVTETAVSPASLSGVDFTFSPTTPIVGQSVSFTASVAGGTPPFSYAWKFSDGVIATGNPTSRAFSVKGTYSVTLNVTDSSSPSATATVSHAITVSPSPLTSDFSFSPPFPCLGRTATFTGSASGGTAPYSFSWSFGDGTAKVSGNPAFHTYSVMGTFTVTMNATDSNAATKSVTHALTVPDCPFVVSISGPTTGTVGTPVSFTATGSGGIPPYTFLWSFGDGTANVAGGVANPNSQSHIYSVKGSYTVNVTITDAGGAKTFGRTTITINPIALSTGFTSAPTTGTVGALVSFTVRTFGGTAPYSFSWNFGDGTGNQAGGFADPNSLSHTYTVKGTYTVRVNATDVNGKIASASAGITIATPNLSMTASCPQTAIVGTTIQCTATATGGTSPYSFSWSFGDGTANIAGNPASHVYDVHGLYTVKVNATDANAQVVSASTTIMIQTLTLAVSPTVPATGTVGMPVPVSVTASGGTPPYFFSWNFGDGTANVAGSTIAHTYTVKGTYTLRVNVTDISGKTASASSSITISPLPLTVTPTVPATGTVGTQVSVSATASGGTPPYTFSWTFGDGSTATGNPATHTYFSTGPFTVTVNVTDANSNQATASHSLSLGPPPPLLADFGPVKTLVGTTTFVSLITGGLLPYRCVWTFGDGTPLTIGCNPDHTYIGSGVFTAQLTITDNMGQRISVTHVVKVDGNPTFTGSKLHWDRKLSLGNAEIFSAKMTNPSDFNVTVTVTIDIFTGNGIFIAHLTASENLAPGATDTNFPLSFTPTKQDVYLFSATLTYSATLQVNPSTTSTVTGIDGTRTGIFTVF